MQEMLTPREVARELNITMQHTYRLIWDASLPAERRDGRWYIPVKAVEERKRRRRDGGQHECSEERRASCQLHLLLKRSHEVCFAFLCAECAQPILDPAEGILIFDMPRGEGRLVAAVADDRPTELFTVPVYAVHRRCERLDRLGRCWHPLDCVFTAHQRRAPGKKRQGRRCA